MTKHDLRTPADATVAAKNGYDKWANLSTIGRKGDLTWGEVSPTLLQDTLAAVTEDGAAVLLSKTSDGGALMCQVLSDRSKPKYYASSYEEVTDMLNVIKEIAEGK